MKRIVIAIALCAAQSMIQARGGSGGAIAGGVFGGMVLGSMIASANQPRYVQAPPAQTVVIRDEPRQQVVQRVCVDEDGYEIPCPPKRQRVADHPDNY